MPIKVQPDVFRVVVPAPDDYPKDTANVYLIRGENYHLIVDAAAPMESSAHALAQNLDQINIDLAGKPVKVLLTHTHPDHAGQVELLDDTFDTTCYFHPYEFLSAKLRDFYLSDLEPALKTWAESHGVEYSIFHEVLTEERFREIPRHSSYINGGVTLDQGNFEWNVLWTPGHSLGHLSLYESRHRLLIVGDHVHPDGAPYLLKTPWLSSNPVIDYLDSLRELSQLRTDIVLPGHGAAFDDLQTPIQNVYKGYRRKKSDILETVGNDSMTVWEITRHIINPCKFDNLNREQKTLSFFEMLAYVEALQVKGRVRASFCDGKVLVTAREDS